VAHCATQLARYKCPKRFVVRTALPLLPVGKVDKQALKAAELGEPT
jgi:acyl-CoA synthetase (AMP-forming)/AMP-acid ligase II